MSALHFDADIDDKKLTSKVNKINSDLHNLALRAANSGSILDNSFKKAGQSADDFSKKTINAGNAMASIGALVSLSVLANWGKEMANVRGEFQKFEAVLTNTLNGDQVKASSLLQGISDFAAKTPYQLTEITEGFVKMANQGIVLSQNELKKLGDFAAVTGKPIGQLFEAIMDINNTERWKEFGTRVTTEGERVAISFRGQKVEFDRTIQGAKDAIAELGSMKGVEGTMSVISKTLIGQISNFEDSWNRMLNGLGQANENTFSGLITGATSLVDSYESVVDAIKLIVLTFGAGKAAAIVYNAVMAESAAVNAMVAASNGVFTKSLALQWLWTERATTAQTALNKSMLLNPYVIAATAIVGLVAGLVIMNKRFEESIDAKKRFDEQTKKLNESYQTRIDESSKLTGILNSETEAESKRIEALRALKELYPDIFGQMDLHNSKLLKISEVTKQVAEIEAKRNLQAQREYIASLIRERDKISKETPDQVNAFDNPLGYKIYADMAQKKMEQLNKQIQKEGERETQMLIDQVDAQQSQREESEKTIVQRIKEANSIEKLGKLREEWDKKWQSATNAPERNKLKNDLDLIDKSLKSISGKTENKEITGEYNKLEAAIKKASDALINASEKERPALQEKLSILVKQKQAWEDLIKAQRGEAKDLKPLGIKSPVIGGAQITEQLKPMKQLTDEQKKQLEAKSKQLGLDAVAKENWEQQIDLIQQSVSFLDESISKYGEMLGLSEDQQKALENGMNAMKGMAQIASGNVIQGAFTLIASLADTLTGKPEKISEIFEGIDQNIQKVIKSIDIASKSLGNMNKDSSSTSMKIIKAQLLDLADSAKQLNNELAGSSTGRRRETNMSLPNIVKQAADINIEIEKLSNRLLQGDISDEQRKAIEAILDGYNSLLSKIDSTIQDITGTTVSDLSRSLSDAILDGADAWEVWGQKANDVIKNVISKQLTAKLINAPITDAVNALVNDSMNGLTTDESLKFKDAIKSIYESVVPAYEATKNSLKGVGIDISNAETNASARATGISAQMTEETGSLVAGQFMAMRVDIKTLQETGANSLELMDLSLSALNQIARNTSHNVRLNDIADSVNETNKILKEKL